MRGDFCSGYCSQQVCLFRIVLGDYRRVSCAITYHELAAGLGFEPCSENMLHFNESGLENG